MSAAAFGVLIIGNGLVFPLTAWYVRHVTMTVSSWHSILILSLVIGGALPLVVVAAVGVVAWRARKPKQSNVGVMVGFALAWSMVGLVANHNAISDLLHGPTTHVARVERTRIVKETDHNGHGIWHTCRLIFADGSTRELDRYSVHYTNDDPCHCIKAGDQVRLDMLPHLGDLLAIHDLASGGS